MVSLQTLTLTQLQQIFAARTLPDLTLLPDKRCSAVAMLFTVIGGELCLCVGRRAAYPGDPWSGDMAFPGGKGEPEDRTFHDIAIREAEEETGLPLGNLQPFGALELLQTFGTATRPPLFVRPVLYSLPAPPPPFHLNGELDAAFWIPLNHLWDPANATTLQYGDPPRTFPGIQFGEDVIWGFTLRMMGFLGEAVG